MKSVILDGLDIYNREDVHCCFAQALDFPEWYGKNLDALHDCLTDIFEETVITINNEDELKHHLGGFYSKLMRVLEDCMEESQYISVEYTEDDLQ